MKKSYKSFICLLAVMFSVCFAGCKPGDKGDQTETGGAVTTPSPPEIELTEPQTSQPDIPDGELSGSADTSGVTGVITLQKTSAEFTGSNISVTESPLYGVIVEIKASGTYVIQGTLNQGFVAVAKKELEATLILNGVNIYCSNYAPIVCTKKSDVVIELAEGSANYLTDGKEYAFDYDADHEPNACLYIRKDITVRGEGALTVNANNNNGIGTKANLKITGGAVSVNAVNNALKGNDSVNISGGVFKLVSHEDGIKSDNTAEDGLGYINITGGSFEIVAAQDAVQSSASLKVSDAAITVKTGGGSAAAAASDSAKGLKAETALTIESGTFNIDSNDDGLHTNGDVTVNGGGINISAGDDGIHADNNLTINGGTVNISKSYEGLESQNVNLNGGDVRILASDDGINISGGADGSSLTQRPGGRPGTPGGQSAIDGTLTITGGYCYVNASGDGLDSNGNIVMSGGLVIVHGPTADMDAPIDYDGSFKMTGGTIIALGSSGMAQQPGSSSTQYSVLVKFSSVAAGRLLNLKSSAGKDIVTIACVKTVKSLAVSSPELDKGSYTLSAGGSYSVAANGYGLFAGGSYSGGTAVKTFSVSNMITTVN